MTCYKRLMTREQIKAALDRVLTWPPERQKDALEFLNAIEALDRSAYGLTDEQETEVRRRLASPAQGRIPFETVFEGLRATNP